MQEQKKFYLIKCDGCGKTFERDRQYMLLRKRKGIKMSFCNHKCQHAWRSAQPKKSRKEINDDYNRSDKGRLTQRFNKQLHKYGLIVNYEDKECGMCGRKDKLLIHHIDGNNGKQGRKLNNDKNNLIILCQHCHPKIHRKGKLVIVKHSTWRCTI